jgi:hypothetical protein
MPKGEQNTGQELGASFFGADLDGIYRQHEAMWSVYSDSLRLLVTVTSLPLLAAALFIHEGKELPQLAHLPSLLKFILILTPIFDFFMIAVVINHRLVMLLYARCLNGYRGLFLAKLPSEKLQWEKHIPLPTTKDTPRYYEFKGPMGVIVHGIGLVCGVYLVFGFEGIPWLWLRIGIAVVYFAGLELWYRWNCKQYPGAAEARPSGA